MVLLSVNVSFHIHILSSEKLVQLVMVDYFDVNHLKVNDRHFLRCPQFQITMLSGSLGHITSIRSHHNDSVTLFKQHAV